MRHRSLVAAFALVGGLACARERAPEVAARPMVVPQEWAPRHFESLPPQPMAAATSPPPPPAASSAASPVPCGASAAVLVPSIPSWFPLPVAPAPAAAVPCTPAADTSAAPLPAPAGPPADLAARTAEARSLLGAGARTEVVGEVFIVASPASHAAFPSHVALAKKAAEAYFHGRITSKPRGSIPVYVFGSTTSYDAFCKAIEGTRCDSPLGFYDPMRRHVVVNAQNGIGSLTHEMMHPLIEADFPGAPDWFDEGIASLFGKAVFPRPGEVHGATNWRLPELQRALGSPRAAEAHLTRLFGMSSGEFRNGRQGLHYAMARYLCQWLDEQDKLWPFYQAWRTRIGADPTGAQTFTLVTGLTPAQANAAWIAWVKSLRAGS